MIVLRRLALLAAFLPGTLAAQDQFTRITDLLPGTASGVPEFDATVWNGKLYFRTHADDFVYDLRAYDGVNPPAIVAGGAGVNPLELTLWNDALYFAGGSYLLQGLQPETTDRELWRYDGLIAPAEALDLAASSGPHSFAVFGDELCFAATTGAGDELNCWDGMTAPTTFDLRPGALSSNPKELAVHDGVLYFSAQDSAHGTEPWAWNGVGSPARIADLAPDAQESLPFSFTSYSDEVYFGAYPESHSRLFHMTAGGTPLQIPGLIDVQGALGIFGGALFVAGGDAIDVTTRLQRIDESGRVGLQPGVANTDSFLQFGNALYFVAGLSTGDQDIWRYCGSESVEKVSAPFAANNAGINRGLLSLGDRILFSGFDATAGSELWALRPMEAIYCNGFLSGDFDFWSATEP
ncbi:MAG: hypothetical protein ABI639_11250 [Thermoanaerobaculia bacterium]